MTKETKGWTPERRAAQRERILKLKPWEKSTGPRTLIGKLVCSENAVKHGNYSAEMRAARQILYRNKLFVDEYRAFEYYIFKNRLKNELKKRKGKFLYSSET